MDVVFFCNHNLQNYFNDALEIQQRYSAGSGEGQDKYENHKIYLPAKESKDTLVVTRFVH